MCFTFWPWSVFLGGREEGKEECVEPGKGCVRVCVVCVTISLVCVYRAKLVWDWE